jgi:hypothetical protein
MRANNEGSTFPSFIFADARRDVNALRALVFSYAAEKGLFRISAED